jgi:hypothetical protein
VLHPSIFAAFSKSLGKLVKWLRRIMTAKGIPKAVYGRINPPYVLYMLRFLLIWKSGIIRVGIGNIRVNSNNVNQISLAKKFKRENAYAASDEKNVTMNTEGTVMMTLFIKYRNMGTSLNINLKL